ncbi:MAG: septum formation initiator family protein [Actinomycetota bacterium]|nr:septum formation initiator family protein [Actinomycetota bacterium]
MNTLLRTARVRLGVGPQIVAVILMLGLAGAMAIEPTRRLIEQRDRIALMSQDLVAIDDANSALETRITRLNDRDFLEQKAREMGLVRRGEKLYVVLPPSRKVLHRRAVRAERKNSRPETASWLEQALHFIGVG